MPNFCSNCEAKLEPGQKFCTQCGTPVTGSSADSQQAGVQPAAEQPTQVIESESVAEGAAQAFGEKKDTKPIPIVADEILRGTTPQGGIPQDTQVMPAVNAVPKAYVQPDQAAVAAPAEGDNRNKVLIIVAIVLAAILVVLLGVIAVNSFSGNDEGEAAQTEEATEATTESKSGESDSKSTEVDPEEQAIYNNLTTYYNKLASYDDQIASAATTFNNKYLDDSSSVRANNYKSVQTLVSNLQSDISAVSSMGVTGSSQYYSTWNDIMTCYDDCYMRISVIEEAWSIAQYSNDPDIICEPLARDKENGSNKYKTDFDSRYPKCKPAAPSN